MVLQCFFGEEANGLMTYPSISIRKDDLRNEGLELRVWSRSKLKSYLKKPLYIFFIMQMHKALCLEMDEEESLCFSASAAAPAT